MKFTKEILEKAIALGSDKVSQDFAKLSGQAVKVANAEVSVIPHEGVVDDVHSFAGEQSVVAYAQLLTGLKGLSILTLTRDGALSLVDLLNNREVGSAGVLMEIDRSAIKETLNILANSYLTTLAEVAQAEFGMDVPYLVPMQNLEEIMQKVNIDQQDADALVLRTKLTIQGHDVDAHLYLVFGENLTELLKNIK